MTHVCDGVLELDGADRIKFQALAKLFVELFVVILRLGNFGDHFQGLPHQAHLDDDQDTVLLQTLPEMYREETSKPRRQYHLLEFVTKYFRNPCKVLSCCRVSRCKLDKVQPLWNEIVTTLQNENKGAERTGYCSASPWSQTSWTVRDVGRTTSLA